MVPTAHLITPLLLEIIIIFLLFFVGYYGRLIYDNRFHKGYIMLNVYIFIVGDK